MLRFITSRLLQSLLTLFLIITATFFLLRYMPGGPFTAERNVSKETLAQLQAHYGLNKPLHQQYLDYLGKVIFHGDLGPSYKYANRSINEILAETIPVSFELGSIALTFALVLGITLGTLAALRRNTWIDYGATFFGTTGISIPTFVVGPILVLICAIQFGWFNASGWYEPRDRVLPALVLGLAYAAPITRLTRGGMLEILNQDFIRTARAKGASESRVILRHALRGGLLPVVSFLGPAIAGILTGSFVIETIFQIPGVGRNFVTSVSNRDYTLVLGTTIVFATLIMALNLASDIVQSWLNPKIRLDA